MLGAEVRRLPREGPSLMSEMLSVCSVEKASWTWKRACRTWTVVASFWEGMLFLDVGVSYCSHLFVATWIVTAIWI